MTKVNEHYAVIDLGTNTFHLLIVKKNKTNWEEIYRKRVFVNIAKEGIQTIGKASYERGMETIIEFHNSLQEFDVRNVKVFGTAALRTATNGPAFQSEVQQKTGLSIEIINGQREAELIAKGTKAVVDMSMGNYLIMDIGGGSVEFILVQDDLETYVESFPIGITSLYRRFPHKEPITEVEIQRINDYLSGILVPLRERIGELKINGLIGASGSYEVLEQILSNNIAKSKSSKFPIDEIVEQIDRIIKLDLAERLQEPAIPEQRAKLIVIAFLLMKHVEDLSSFDSMIISPFALKEGALIEMIG